MCKCTPMIKTPYCGKGECQRPKQEQEAPTEKINFITSKMHKVIEDVQKAQVDAGGRFIRQHEIANMTFGELLKQLIPNDVRFEIYHTKDSPFHDKGD